VAPIIEARDLVKDYRKRRRSDGFAGSVRTLFSREYDLMHAVDGVSFSIETGEFVGYLGPNGAGKSTTIKMMTGVLVPTSGQITVGGLVPWRDRERNALQIGVVFGQRSQLWWDLPLIDSFRLIAKLYRMPHKLFQRNLDQFIDLLDMASFLNQPVRQLSLGQRMRGDLAASMLYEPPILYLDEPTIGLDVIAKDRMRRFVAEMNASSATTIVLTTHDLADVEQLCHRIILIDHGRVLYDGGVEQLKAAYAPHRVLTIQLAPDAEGRIPEIRGDDVLGAELVDQEGDTVRLRFETGVTPVQALIAAVNDRYPVRDLSIDDPDLEDVVRDLYGEKLPRT